jgi:uncharacterized protein with von Willebrand factor type A (vWA) domain
MGGASGKKSALKVIGERRYVDYAADTTLRGDNLRQALATLKNMVPAGPRDELDLDATIHESARNGGEIDLVFQRRLLDRIEVVLLIDNGGYSMTPFARLTRLLFSKVKDRFRRCDTYFFHNTIYGRIYRDPRRLEPIATGQLLGRSPETRVLVVGDAAMAPEELESPRGAIAWDAEDAEPSIVWLRRLRDRFSHTVWLNPIPKEEWPETHGFRTISRIGEVFPMEDLTLGGIQRAVDRLNRPKT